MRREESLVMVGWQCFVTLLIIAAVGVIIWFLWDLILAIVSTIAMVWGIIYTVLWSIGWTINKVLG